MMWNWSGWSGVGPGWWLVHALFWLALIWGLIVLFKGKRGFGGRDRAEQILRERYAKGELSREAFERMRTDLQAR